MKNYKALLTLGLAVACVALTFGLAVCAQGQTVTNFANFDGVNGRLAQGQTIVQATNGRFYGTTTAGGANGKGNVYELTPTGKLSNVYSFCSLANCADGQYPNWTPVLGSDGNLYGVTYSGGSGAGNTSGSGTVYRISLSGEFTTLYTFCAATPCVDGQFPNGVIQGSDGNLYGTTNRGGNASAGTVFEISSTGEFKSLYSFCSLANCDDGEYPGFPPIQGNDGNIYGIAGGGTETAGVLYELTASGTLQVLYNFCFIKNGNCPDGSFPTTIVQDASGNFFGTVTSGGSHGYGAVFEITTENEYSVLQSFNFATANPYEGVTLASDGNLYGTTLYGAGNSNAGTIFEVTPERVARELYVFTGGGITGSDSWSPLFQATDGNLYGSTNYGGGGKGLYGTIFKLSNGLSPLVETVPVRGSVGTSVIILGNNLTGSTSVTFNGVAAKFTVESESYIKATVPTGASTGVVSVVTPSGTLNSNPQFVVSK